MGCKQSKNVTVDTTTNIPHADGAIQFELESERVKVEVKVETIDVEEESEEMDVKEELIEEDVNDVVDAMEQAMTQSAQGTEEAESETESVTAAESETESVTAGESDEGTGVFVTSGCITKSGVTYYQYSAIVSNDTETRVIITKRYNEFSSLYRKVEKLMVRCEHVPSNQVEMFKTYPALPALPRTEFAPFWYGNNSKAMKKKRENSFLEILNAISRHPVARNSKAFQEFLH
uniref:Uncharacterized protein AlNc14C124G6771 n=1 Tax=Albugo laibachii Nc14 TaxID=890382 RepID=F0WJP5_9STRA|nr:conserved hypothetical protein [Albugo laibachii Nc14]|eukprot:CCA21496.1 conserved hypothetical protein [Albugo laibachii Nc14]